MTLYSLLYRKFSELQTDDQSSSTSSPSSPRLVYPTGHQPLLKVSYRDISDCSVGIPEVQIENGILRYGPFVLRDDAFGHYAITRLVLASTCLLGAKAPLLWRCRQAATKWVKTMPDWLRAEYVKNTVLDRVARQTIHKFQGRAFYQDVMVPADLLSATLLSHRCNTLPEFTQTALAKVILGISPSHITSSSDIKDRIGEFVRLLDSCKIPSENVEWSNDNDQHQQHQRQHQYLEEVADQLYAVIQEFPGKWHSIYLPYANSIPVLANAGHVEIFRGGLVERGAFETALRQAGRLSIVPEIPTADGGDDNDGVFNEVVREKQRVDKVLSHIARLSKNLNFGTFGFPLDDYVRYRKLYAEMLPQIRRVVEHARLIRNVMDENMFEESGSLDLQLAIQAIASETPRRDMFVKDENLLKNETWAILIDSSLSLGSLGKQLTSAAICVAESAKELVGQNPWGMYAFSDDFYCVKDFTEPYDSLARARIGGLGPSGLSHIPDAIRLARNMLLEYSKERNYIVLISDGLASGYEGIEKEFSRAVKELYSHGITLAAIGMGGSSKIRQEIANSRLVSNPTDMAKTFSDLYSVLSSS